MSSAAERFKALRPCAPAVPSESGLVRAMAERDGESFDRLVGAWIEVQPHKPLMNWGVYHFDAWGMGRALAQGVDLKGEHLKAYFDLLVPPVRESALIPEGPDLLRVWPALWEHMKDHPRLADTALLLASSLRLDGPERVEMDWTDRRLEGLFSHVPASGTLTWEWESPREFPFAARRTAFCLSALQLAWMAADVPLCKALLAGGASATQEVSASDWPSWTFKKATTQLPSLLAESMHTSVFGEQQQDQKVDFLSRKARTCRRPSHDEEVLARLVRWVPLNQALPAPTSRGPKPRF